MRSDALAKRRALVLAARRLFSDAGLEVPLRTIATEADVGIATLYRHFPTREDLVLGVADQVRGEMVDICGRARETWDADPPLAWRRFAEQLAGMHMGALAAQLQNWSGLGDVISQRPDSRHEVLESLDSVLALAKQAGLVHETVRTLDFHLGLAAIARRFPDQPFISVPENHERWLLDIYLAGLRAGPSPALRDAHGAVGQGGNPGPSRPRPEA